MTPSAGQQRNLSAATPAPPEPDVRLEAVPGTDVRWRAGRSPLFNEASAHAACSLGPRRPGDQRFCGVCTSAPINTTRWEHAAMGDTSVFRASRFGRVWAVERSPVRRFGPRR
jgi:hypothetical protein